MDISHIEADKSKMQNVKKRFFAMRNGIIADTLRKAGSPYRIIFGLNLPQIKEIAAAFGYDENLATELWLNKETRESRILAPMLVNPSDFDMIKARQWLENLTGSTEEIDILCHSLLRKINDVTELTDTLYESDDSLKRYAALRLMFAQVMKEPTKIKEKAEKEIARKDPRTMAVAMQLLEEASLYL